MKHPCLFYVCSSGNQQMRLSSCTLIKMQYHQINLVDSLCKKRNPTSLSWHRVSPPPLFWIHFHKENKIFQKVCNRRFLKWHCPNRNYHNCCESLEKMCLFLWFGAFGDSAEHGSAGGCWSICYPNGWSRRQWSGISVTVDTGAGPTGLLVCACAY